MALHVDIIKTNPLSTGEGRLARAVYADGSVTIDRTADSGYWRAALATATSVDPDEDPKGFFEALEGALDGTYVYATSPHDEADCPVEHPKVA